MENGFLPPLPWESPAERIGGYPVCVYVYACLHLPFLSFMSLLAWIRPWQRPGTAHSSAVALWWLICCAVAMVTEDTLERKLHNLAHVHARLAVS